VKNFEITFEKLQLYGYVFSRTVCIVFDSACISCQFCDWL